MSDYQSRRNLSVKDLDNSENKYFSNVFSKINKSEKNKQYQVLQTNLNSLSKEVRLLEEYANKDNFNKKKKNVYKGNQYKKFIDRSNFLLKQNRNKRKTSILDIISNYINAKYKESSKRKNKNKKTKRFNRNKDKRLIYKTEINKSLGLINGYKLPKIHINLDKTLDTNIDSSFNNNNNGSVSSRLPSIQNRPQKKVYLYSEGNKIQKNNININNNLFVKKFPKILNNERLKSSINRYELSQSADKMVKIMNEKNQKIKNKINLKLAEENLIDWEMKSRMKLAEWKYGIAEIDKYFVDLRAYGKPEEEELIKRKTFYDFVEEVIDDVKETKEEKYLRKIKEDYNVQEINEEENNDLNIVENAINKHSEVNKVLEKIKLRKIKEQKKRQLIDNIFIKNNLGIKNINLSTEKLNKNKEKIKTEINEENNNIIDFKKVRDKILVNNEKKEF